VERQKIAQATKGIGKPKVGGPFSLIDQDGRPFTSEDLRDKYALVSNLYLWKEGTADDSGDSSTLDILIVRIFVQTSWIKCLR
jgi:hypothetical protein